MNLYLAASFTNSFGQGQTSTRPKMTPVECEIMDTVPHKLESYHYIYSDKYVREIREAGGEVFLDSGAFSAWTMGIKVDINAYCQYIQRNEDIIRKDDGRILMASVLDAVGDPLGTYRNQLEMEARGVRPLPCFHRNEDEKFLEYYIENYEYITLGGMVGCPVDQLILWLDRIWDRYLLDSSGNPRLKVHAFGITSDRVMRRYPWYSVDSSSWHQYAIYGHLYDPIWGMLSVSEKSPNRFKRGYHLCNLTDIEQQRFIDEIEERGFTWDRLSTVSEARSVFNAQSFVKMNRMINDDLAKREKSEFSIAVQELF